MLAIGSLEAVEVAGGAGAGADAAAGAAGGGVEATAVSDAAGAEAGAAAGAGDGAGIVIGERDVSRGIGGALVALMRVGQRARRSPSRHRA